MTTMSGVPRRTSVTGSVTEIASVRHPRPRGTEHVISAVPRTDPQIDRDSESECRHNTPVQLAHGNIVKAESQRNR